MTSRLSLLLMIVLWTSTLASAQKLTTSTSATLTRHYITGQPVQTYRKISAIPIPDPRVLYRGKSARDKSFLWKVHLALQLVKYPKMDDRQVRIILDAIALSSSEFFAANNTISNKTKADYALQSLTRRAFRSFPHRQATQLFAKINAEKTEDDILRLYFDLSALPLRKRKVSFRNATSNQKSELWRTHLALWLVKRELNERQTNVILAALSLATSEHFEVPSNDPDWKTKVRALEEQIATAFSLEEAVKIFATLGDDADANQSATNAGALLRKSISYKPLSNTGPYKQRTHHRFSEQGVELERSACQCSTQSDWCPMSSACTTGNCSSTQSGCGTLWTFPCDGAACQ